MSASYTLNSTTLSAAITAATTSIPLASTANVAVGDKLMIDAELTGTVTAVSSTAATVSRDPTSRPTSHASGATVWIGLPSQFFLGDPPVGGNVTAAQPDPWINATNGNVWRLLNSAWVLVTPAQPLGGLAQQKNAAVASASTIAPNQGVTHVTGTTAIETITVPEGLVAGGQITLIPDALGSTGTSGNIALGSTFVVSKALILTWDGSKWYPSY